MSPPTCQVPPPPRAKDLQRAKDRPPAPSVEKKMSEGRTSDRPSDVKEDEAINPRETENPPTIETAPVIAADPPSETAPDTATVPGQGPLVRVPPPIFDAKG